MREAFLRRVRAFAAELGVEVEAIVNVALTHEQVAEHGIPTRPQKDSTHRRESDGDLAAELDAVEALYPGLLGEWLAEAIEPYCSAQPRETVRAHIAQTNTHLAGLAVKLDEDAD
jgi:hypothetical protein